MRGKIFQSSDRLIGLIDDEENKQFPPEKRGARHDSFTILLDKNPCEMKNVNDVSPSARVECRGWQVI